MTLRPSVPLRVRVPGSTSNLGPGYDVLGLAVDRFLHAEWTPGDGPLSWTGEGTLEGLPPERDLVSAVLAETLKVPRTDLGGRLRLRSDIPVARGLGSSAVARIAGVLLARLAERSDDAPESPVPLAEGERRILTEQVCRAEGHPDNAVPSLVGGLVASSMDEAGVRWTPLPMSPAVGMVFAAPPVEVRTADARRALPARIDHVDAAANGARLAVLLVGLATADGDRIAWGLRDRLHVPWRWPLVPRADEADEAARAAGAWGVTLSGSGSGLLAFAPLDRCDAVRSAMAEAFAPVEGGGGRWAFVLRRSVLGATCLPR